MAVFENRGPSSSDQTPPSDREVVGNLLGPQAVDQMIRQALSTCWVLLPENRRNVTTVEQEIRRIVDRAIVNFKEDSEAFGGK
jgi:hypothetical protein